MSPKAYDQSTSEPLPQPALSASPRRWRPRALTEYEREQSRLWGLQQIRSEPILERGINGVYYHVSHKQHMRTNLRTESGRYGCRSRVICCRISIPPCIRPKKQRTFGSQVPTAASGKNRNSLNIRRADRPCPCGFCGGSLCANSGHSFSTTARISSEIWSMCSISSMYL